MSNLAKIGIQAAKKAAQEAKGKTKELGIKAVKSTIQDVKVKPGQDPKQLSNFYTGKKLNPYWVGGVGGAYLLGQSAYNAVGYNSFKPLQLATTNDLQHYGAPDVMMYDGVGQEPAPKNMNANGSIVFGLHNSRKG